MNLSNHPKRKSNPWTVFLCCTMAAATLPVAAAQTKTTAPGKASAKLPATPPSTPPLSVFIQPNTPKDGRDPFFPTSTRPYASAVFPKAKTEDLSSLEIRGKSGTVDRPLVIINDVTFAVGDDRDVITPDGRIHIHCLEIIGDVAVIEANGQRHRLRFETKP